VCTGVTADGQVETMELERPNSNPKDDGEWLRIGGCKTLAIDVERAI
jgi:hypothetical protein